MLLGLIADIHANLEAFQAVLCRIEDVDAIICAGDIIGYGADPVRCTELIRNIPCVLGNHEAAVLGALPLAWFNPVAQAAIIWTKGQLKKENMTFLKALPLDIKKQILGLELYVVHGSPATRSYEDYVEWPTPADFKAQINIIGHTHIQNVWILRKDKILKAGKLTKIRYGERYLINPGGLGQPRDFDARAPYALIDISRRIIKLGRVEYDVATAADKIIAAGLPAALAERLFSGT
jgi:predicted phosphodiesterase